jgi:hypothetical protein
MNILQAQKAKFSNNYKKKQDKFTEKKCTILIKQNTFKAMPLRLWTGPEGSRRLRLPDIKTIGT